ncbi:unnamed protein product [Adineta ricciae]|uniref:3'-5' exonuclease domain-containing protein n=1 Tax=Adineta ricciae TaxID=249248 RepID=A0A813PWJ1_ADIRI|nr:unnamed protein product [Adineta ricciae]CAF1220303.1 unnamed protein product [Adineta ricciae]
MSTLLATLSEKILSNPSEATQLGIEHFNQSSKPFDDLLEYLTQLSDTDSNSKNINLIAYLLQAFSQWKNQFYKSSSLPQFDNTVVNDLLLKTLPLTLLKDFLQIFEISKEYLLSLIRTSFKSPSHSSTYKRALNMIVTLDYQLEFQPNEILLPLILTSKDHYIDIYLNKTRQYEVYLLKLLNHLHEQNGKQLSEILANEYQMKDVPFSKKSVSKLAVRYWNLLGNDEDENYPNLKILQQKRTLSFLLNTRYNGLSGEKTMSDECWNELVGEIVQDNADLSEYLIEMLADKDDIAAVKYWMVQLDRPYYSLPTWVQQYIHIKQNNEVKSTNPVETVSNKIDYYRIPLADEQIIFVDSIPTFERLMIRLSQTDNEEFCIGFDCEWKPVFNNTLTSRQRISIMQLAFSNEIYLLDLLHFFRTCDPETVQQQLANRLFNNDHITLLSYGFKTDAAMLIASFPSFEQALSSGKTLVDLSVVQAELLSMQRDIFPYVAVDNKSASKDKGLSELVRLCFGKPLNKSEQCSNWERRPLRRAQTLYAATDAYCLLDVYKFIANHFRSSDYLQSFRGKKPKNLASAVARQIDENFHETNLGNNNNTSSPQLSNDMIQTSHETIRPSQIKFVVDNMLYGLGRELRVAGCDTIILANEEPHTAAIRYARSENRIILSRGAPYNLLRSHTVEGRCWQPPLNVSAKEQCAAVLRHFNVQVLLEDIFSRCSTCNGGNYAIVNARDIRLLWCKMQNYPLEELEPELVNYQSEQIDIDRITLKNENVPLVLTGLTLKNYRSYEEFYICRQCGKVYWQGTHWRRRARFPQLQSNVEVKQIEKDDSDSDDGIVFYDAESNL